MYNLGHLGLYKNIPKKRMFNSTPNYERDSYSLLQYKSHLRNEFLIPLKADGNGTGVATIYLQSTESQTINITGSGRFYTDAQGTTGESTSAIVGTSLTTLYVKLSAGSCYLVLTKADKLLGFGSSSVNVITEVTNAPFINGCNIGYKIHNLINIKLQGNTKSFFTGSIDNCRNLIILDIYNNKTCVITGSIDNCRNLARLIINNNQLCAFTGSIDNCRSLNVFDINNNQLCVITGSIDNCRNLIYFSVGNNTLCVITGDIGKAILCNVFYFDGNTSPLTYVTRRSNWTSSLRIIHISSASMTTEMVDNLFMDIDSSGVPAANEKRINVNGLCAPVSDASLAARNSLVEKGFTLVYNNA
jgi:Leucine-rich repeat (LRR) protein